MRKKLKIIFGVVILYKNFISVFLDYFHIIPPKKIIYRLRNGVKYICRTKTDDFSIINELYIFNAYINYKNPSSKKEKIIIDLGAHIGIFSIQAAIQYPDAKIYSFEPMADNFQFLKQNIALNSLNERIKPFNLAILDKQGKINIFEQETSTGGHTILSVGNKAVTVPCVTLNEVFKQNKIEHCDILKIDVEGAEKQIFDNSINLLAKIDKIFMEYHGESYPQEYWEKFLKKHGYKIETNQMLKIIKATKIR